MSAHKVNRDLKAAGAMGIQTKCYDSSGNITFDSGATVPGSVAGYATGCIFVQNDAPTPGQTAFVNTGTATTASFSAIGLSTGQITIPIAINGGLTTGSAWVHTAAYPQIFSGGYFSFSGLFASTLTMSIRKVTAASGILPGDAAGASVIEMVTPFGIGNGQITLNTGYSMNPLAALASRTMATGDRIAILFGSSPGTIPTGQLGSVTLNIIAA